jgi:hypothetical protein
MHAQHHNASTSPFMRNISLRFGTLIGGAMGGAILHYSSGCSYIWRHVSQESPSLACQKQRQAIGLVASVGKRETRSNGYGPSPASWRRMSAP